MLDCLYETVFMNSCPLGSTSLQVTPLGLGLAALGRPGYINLGHGTDLAGRLEPTQLERHTHTVLDTAWKSGMRYFDAARSYGRAEAFLGSWLGERNLTPAELVVGSKWGYTYTADWQREAEAHEVKEHSRAKLDEQWGESLALLGDHLELYQIHSATLESGVLDDPRVLGRLAELKTKSTAIGLTLSGPGQGRTLERALQLEAEGKKLFDTVQATWNPLERAAEPALRAAQGEGLGVIHKEVLANGRLTPRNDAPAFAAKLKVLETQAERLRTTIPALVFAASLTRPWVSVTLTGAATEAQVHETVGALAVPWDDEVEAALHGLTEPSEAYWQTRAALSWG